MAHVRIGKENPPQKEPKKFAEDSAMKPLVRDYIKENPDCVRKEFPVIGGRLTKNGWFLLEAKEFVYLLPGKNQNAQNLFDTIFPALNGKEMKQLLLIPDKSDKYGAYLAVDTEKKTHYVWDSVDFILYVGETPSPKERRKQLSVEDFE